MLVRIWALVIILLHVTAAGAQSSGADTLWVAGGYNCGDGTAVPAKQKLILFTDGRWSKPRAFDPSSPRIEWIRVQTGRVKGLMAFVTATDHGRFRQADGRLRLYRLEQGVVHTGGFIGQESRFAKQTPDALLSFEQTLLIDPDSHDLLEILPFNAQRQPVRCTHDGLF